MTWREAFSFTCSAWWTSIKSLRGSKGQHMKIVIEIVLGNDTMTTPDDVRRAVNDSLDRPGRYEPMAPGGRRIIHDMNGNTVGYWQVTK